MNISLNIFPKTARSLPLMLLALTVACEPLRKTPPSASPDAKGGTAAEILETRHAAPPPPILTSSGETLERLSATPLQDLETKLEGSVQNNSTPLEIRGTESFLGDPAPIQGSKDIWVEEGEDGVLLKFENTDLLSVTRTILGNLLNKDYVIEAPISGTVSLSTVRRVKREALLPLLSKLLAANSAALLEEDGLYRVTSIDRAPREAARTPALQLSGDPGHHTLVVPLRYISVEEMQRLLQPFLPPNSLLQVDSKRNLLILAGNSPQVEALLGTIRLFDVSWLAGMSMALVPLQHVEPQVLLADLERALEGKGGRFLNGLARLAPIQRLNALLIVTSESDLIDEFRTWIQRLDVTGRQTAPRLFVYRVQNSKATDLAALLNGILRRESDPVSSRTPLAPGLAPVHIESPPTAETPGATETSPSALVLSSDGVTLPIGSSEVRLLADEVHNSLLILATPHDYRIVESALAKLDIMPLQVLIEARILEVRLNDKLQYGVEWFFKNKIGDKTGQGVLDLDRAGANISQIGNSTPALGNLRLTAPGFTYTLLSDASDIRALINALASESRVNMLAAPSLMVLDNQTASINIGNRIPVPTRQSVSTVSGTSPLVNEIKYQDTGVILEVTPRVNANGLVTMKIRQEVSSSTSTQIATINAPTIQQRKIESVVAIYSGQTVVLGGLIEEARKNNYSGIPWLMDLPLVGNLFRSSQYETDRSELIILITPRAIGNQEEALHITEEFRRRLREFRLDTESSLPRRNQADPLL